MVKIISNNKVISISNLSKIYSNGLQALDNINLQINQGEIFALLGNNGAGKSTLISIICGIVKPTAGTINILGYDYLKNYRVVRSNIGLVPQELTTDAFETVWNTTKFSRGLFGKFTDRDYLFDLLKKLSLWDKKDAQIRTLSGGMKRRVMIAKALAHQPKILFLDEPSAGIDVSLRYSMWQEIQKLKESGISIVLTTHYLSEAEEMADRIGIIHNGKLIKVANKQELMCDLGRKKLIIHLSHPIKELPNTLKEFNLKINDDKLIFTYDPNHKQQISCLLQYLHQNSIFYYDIETQQSSLEEIFMQLTQ